MTTYYSTHEVTAYGLALANDAKVHAMWEEQVGTMRKLFDEMHAEWEANPTDADGNPIPEPEEPTYPPEPEATAKPPGVFTEATIDGPTELDTSAGHVLVLPPSVVLTDADGNQFAITPDDRDRSFTSTDKSLPRA